VPRDNKYGHVTLENPRHVQEDEPVVVFVAHDRLLLKTLRVYRMLCEEAGSPQNHLDLLDKTASDIKQWQHENYSQTPSSKGFQV
jgi:hypothetical protein